jgi:hypothetical protein
MKTAPFLLTIAIASLLCGYPEPGRTQTTSPAPAPTVATSLPPGVDGVLKLAQAKMSDAIILAKIKGDGISCNLTTDQILYLSGQGVSQNVISALLSSKSGDGASSASSPASPEPPALDDPKTQTPATTTPPAADTTAATSVTLNNGGQEVTIPAMVVRTEDGTADDIEVMRTYYFQANGPIPQKTGDTVVLTHKGPTTDLSQDYVIEGADSRFILFKLATDETTPGAFKVKGRYDVKAKKMELNTLTVPGLGSLGAFGLSKKKIRYAAQDVDGQTQVCTITSKLSSAYYAFFDGKDFYVFQYVAPPKK